MEKDATHLLKILMMLYHIICINMIIYDYIYMILHIDTIIMGDVNVHHAISVFDPCPLFLCIYMLRHLYSRMRTDQRMDSHAYVRIIRYQWTRMYTETMLR